MKTDYDVVIIGGGASGMMASIFSAGHGNSTLVLDHNEKLGKKLYITGKGKCNLTNNSSIENHLNNIIHNSKFMYSALNAFSPDDTINFFENHGLTLRTERGNRVFPESNKSSDVIKTLERAMQSAGVVVSLNNEINSIEKIDNKFNILCDNGIKYTSSNIIVATGGISYSGTGVTGFGYKIAKQFGHKVIKTNSALCPIIVKENIEELNGIKLKNVTLNFENGKNTVSEFGEMLFTFNSLTGPIALTMSSKINDFEIENKKLYIDLKPALTKDELNTKFQREFVEFAKKDLKNYLTTLLPNKFVDFFFLKTKIENKKLSNLTKDDREKLIKNFKQFEFTIKSLENINASIITRGGVDIKDINSKTCESKLVKGLYFIGEVLDLDALTGGFNLQIAWSTGYIAGNSVKGEL